MNINIGVKPKNLDGCFDPHSLNEKFIPLQDLLYMSYLNAKSFTLHEHVYQHQQSHTKKKKAKICREVGFDDDLIRLDYIIIKVG
jgi:hypothetical protein